MMRRLLILMVAAVLWLHAAEARAADPITLQQGQALTNSPIDWCGNSRAAPPAGPPAGGEELFTASHGADADEHPVSGSGEGGFVEGALDEGRGSKLVTVSMGWIGTGIDHLPATGALSAPRRAPLAPSVGELPALTLRRFHDPRHPSYPSSFGPGVFLGYDLSLTLARTNVVPGSGSVMLYDPRDIALRPLDYDAQKLGYFDRTHCSVQGLHLLDGQGQETQNQAAARSAVLTAHNGWKYTFEIIRVAADPAALQRFGRLIREEDRHGNAVVISYQLAADAPDAVVGVDRSKLWKMSQISDAYGRSVIVSYHAAKKDGRWVVATLQAPSGAQYQYVYKENNQLGLTSVIFPDGRKATFSTAPDAATQTTVLRVQDPTGEGARLRQDVYLTNATWIDPAPPHTPHAQTPNMVRMVVDGKGDVAYLNYSVFDAVMGKPTYYVYEGGHSLYRYRHAAWGSVVEVEQAIGWDLGGAQPEVGLLATFNYQRRAAVTIEPVCHRVTSRTDGADHKTTETRDLVTGALKNVTYPDGSFVQASYDAFRQPTVMRDRVGRITEDKYDVAKGDLVSRKTPDGVLHELEHNGLGQQVKARVDGVDVQTFVYDGASRLALVAEPTEIPGDPDAVIVYSHGNAGQISSVTDPVGRQTAYAYDVEERLITVSHPDQTVEHHSFGTGPNNGGRPDLDTDRLGAVTRHDYDANGEEIARVSFLSPLVSLSRGCTYLKGTTLPERCTDRGDATTYEYDDANRQIKVTQQVGATSSLTRTTVYDYMNRAVSTTDPHGRSTYLAYDQNNRKIREIREMIAGSVVPLPLPTPQLPLSYNYMLLQLPRALGQNPPYEVQDFKYDASGAEVLRIDGRGVRWSSSYDAKGRLSQQIENSAGAPDAQAKTEYDHDARDNRARVRHPRHTPGSPFVTAHTYSARNLLTGTTSALGRPEQAEEAYLYGADQRVRRRLDARGNPWDTVWSQATGLQMAEIDPPADVDGNANTADTRAIHAAVRDSLGQVTHEFVAPDASPFVDVASFAVNEAAFDHPLFAESEITTRHDRLHRRTARTVWLVSPGLVDRNNPPIAGDPGYPASHGLTTRWVYDDDLTDGVGLDALYGGAYLAGLDLGPGGDGSAVEETNPMGERSVTIHDGIGRVIETIDALGQATRIVHDQPFAPPPGFPAACPLIQPGAAGDKVLFETITTDPLGHSTSVITDGADRKVGTRDAEGNISSLGLDPACNILCARDPNGVGHDSVFDGLGREISRTDTQGDTVLYAYDKEDELVQTIDALGVASTAVYDGRKQKTSSTDRLGATTLYSYDPSGNPLDRTDPEGFTLSYLHDARGLKIGEGYPGGSTRSFAYDAARRPLSMIDQAGNATAFTHDPANRLIARSYSDGPVDTFVYDDADRLIAASSSRYGSVVTRSWDAAGRMSGETVTVGGESHALSFQHDAAGRPVQLIYPDGALLTRTFSKRDQLESVTFEGAPVASFQYDAGKRRISSTLGNGLAEQRTYRADDRIAGITVPGVLGLGYTYSKNKAPLTQANSTSPADAQAYGYDAEDRLTSYARGDGDTQSWALSPVGDWDLVTRNGVDEARIHDGRHQLVARPQKQLAYALDRGNLTSDGDGRSYAWDLDNRLESAVVNGVQVSYRYDALGRRVQKLGPGQATTFVHEGWRAIAEYAGGAGSPPRRFVFGEALDELLMMKVGGDRYYYHSNHLQSVMALTDAGGAIVEAYRYDPYGRQQVLGAAGPDGLWLTADDQAAPASPLGNPYTYTGQRSDAETGLLFYKNRYYSAELGRFLSPDPRHYDEEGAYAYTDDSPAAAADPMGLDTIASCGRCCSVNLADKWQIFAMVDPGLAPAVATSVTLFVNGLLRNGTWTTGTYALASGTELKPDIAYAYSRESDTTIGAPVSAMLIFQTVYRGVPGSYSVSVPLSGP